MSETSDSWAFVGDPEPRNNKSKCFLCAQERAKGRYIVGDTVIYTKRNSQGKIINNNSHAEIMQFYEDLKTGGKFAIVRYYYTVKDIQRVHAAALSKIQGNVNQNELFSSADKETIPLTDVSLMPFGTHGSRNLCLLTGKFTPVTGN